MGLGTKLKALLSDTYQVDVGVEVGLEMVGGLLQLMVTVETDRDKQTQARILTQEDRNALRALLDQADAAA
jgi:hypothetical protein